MLNATDLICFNSITRISPFFFQNLHSSAAPSGILELDQKASSVVPPMFQSIQLAGLSKKRRYPHCCLCDADASQHVCTGIDTFYAQPNFEVLTLTQQPPHTRFYITVVGAIFPVHRIRNPIQLLILAAPGKPDRGPSNGQFGHGATGEDKRGML